MPLIRILRPLVRVPPVSWLYGAVVPAIIVMAGLAILSLYLVDRADVIAQNILGDRRSDLQIGIPLRLLGEHTDIVGNLTNAGIHDVTPSGMEKLENRQDERLKHRLRQIGALLAHSRQMIRWIWISAAVIALLGTIGLTIVLDFHRKIGTLTRAMLRLADNDTSVAISPHGDHDMLSRMAQALEIFKNHVIAIVHSKIELQKINAHFDIALRNMPHGLCLYDAADRLIIANPRFYEIYGFDPERICPGDSFFDILEYSVGLGNYPGRSLADVHAERHAFIAKRKPGVFVQEMGEGRAVAISHQPMADGGWVATYEDARLFNALLSAGLSPICNT